MTDVIVRDEVARLYPGNVSSDFENNVRREIIDWILSTVTPLGHLDMRDVIKTFWNERLN
jgi:hypothetical protein